MSAAFRSWWLVGLYKSYSLQAGGGEELIKLIWQLYTGPQHYHVTADKVIDWPKKKGELTE